MSGVGASDALAEDVLACSLQLDLATHGIVTEKPWLQQIIPRTTSRTGNHGFFTEIVIAFGTSFPRGRLTWSGTRPFCRVMQLCRT
jgi:hypothetical protein